MIILIILIGWVHTQNCDTTQYMANITSPGSYIPMNQIQSQLFTQFQLPNIANQYNPIQNIIVKPYMNSYVITQLDATNYTITYTEYLVISFLELYSAQYIEGQAVILGATVNVSVTYNNEWQLQGIIVYDGPPQINQIGLQYYSLTYNNVTIILNSNIPALLNTYYNSLTLTFTTSLKQYDYQYTNIQGVKETVNLNTTIINDNYLNGLNISRYFYVIGYKYNQCQGIIISQQQTTYQQLEIFSMDTIQSIYNYSLGQGYFDTVLNYNWKSAEFQFIVGSLQYVLTNFNTDNYPITQQVNGSCKAINSTLSVQSPIYYNVNTNYSCTLENPSNTQALLFIDVNILLQLSLQFMNNQIYFQSKQPKIASYKFTEGISSVKQSQQSLALVYLKSVINYHFNNTFVFGSGFPTLERTSYSYQIANDYLMIYQGD